MRNSSHESDNGLIIIVSTASDRRNSSLSSLEDFYAISMASFFTGQLSTGDDVISKCVQFRQLALRAIGSRCSLVDLLDKHRLPATFVRAALFRALNIGNGYPPI